MDFLILRSCFYGNRDHYLYLRKKEVITIVATEDHRTFVLVRESLAVLVDPHADMANEVGTNNWQESKGIKRLRL